VLSFARLESRTMPALLMRMSTCPNLAAQQLIRTTKGTTGGSYVTLPTVDHISDLVQTGISLLSDSRDVSLSEFLEIPELLDVPAAGLAARRASAHDIGRLREAIPENPLSMGTQEQFTFNRDFHSVMIECCDNALLTIAAQPIFSVLQRNLARSRLGRRFHSAINEHHLAIAGAVQAGNVAGRGGEGVSLDRELGLRAPALPELCPPVDRAVPELRVSRRLARYRVPEAEVLRPLVRRDRRAGAHDRSSVHGLRAAPP
jgi:hypothetical protein